MTPEQQASASLASAAFGNAEVRDRLNQMIEESDNRKPVPDYFPTGLGPVDKVISAWIEEFKGAPEPIRAKLGALGFFAIIKLAEAAVRALGDRP